jgi:hypothetical protein
LDELYDPQLFIDGLPQSYDRMPFMEDLEGGEHQGGGVVAQMPGAGLEPARDFSRGILSPLCLPFHHPGSCIGLGNLADRILHGQRSGSKMNGPPPPSLPHSASTPHFSAIGPDPRRHIIRLVQAGSCPPGPEDSRI